MQTKKFASSQKVSLNWYGMVERKGYTSWTPEKEIKSRNNGGKR
jgi:hypothetical protein